jgi:hypothetical protein
MNGAPTIVRASCPSAHFDQLDRGITAVKTFAKLGHHRRPCDPALTSSFRFNIVRELYRDALDFKR